MLPESVDYRGSHTLLTRWTVYVGGKGDAQQKAIVPGETASHSPYPVDSTTRAGSSEGKPPSFLSAAINSAQQLNLPASTAGLFLGMLLQIETFYTS